MRAFAHIFSATSQCFAEWKITTQSSSIHLFRITSIHKVRWICALLFTSRWSLHLTCCQFYLTYYFLLFCILIIEPPWHFIYIIASLRISFWAPFVMWSCNRFWFGQMHCDPRTLILCCFINWGRCIKGLKHKSWESVRERRDRLLFNGACRGT